MCLRVLTGEYFDFFHLQYFFYQELFQTMIGPLREVTLTYDASGRSKGVASVVFQRIGDGTKAYNQYHNRLIDGS